MLWFLYGFVVAFPSNLLALAAIATLLGLGRLHGRLIGTARERDWHKYAFFTVDIGVVVALAMLAPLSSGGDVPAIFIFRAYGAYYLFPFVAVSALSLSPGLVLWAGATTIAALWAVFAYAVHGMERTVSWPDLGSGASAERYMALLLDPDFIGQGNRIEESLVLGLSAAAIALAVRRARDLVHERVRADAARQRAQRVFGQYVPAQVAETILAERGALEPETREASVLFSDIEGFTRLSETRDPAAVIALLNDYFTVATEVVTSHGGVVIGFVGDAVLAAFNAPLEAQDHAARAVAAGRGLLDTVAARSFGGETLQLRVGIATGPVAAGSVGGTDRQTYTVYGDTVNLAQRLEALNKELGTRLLLAESTCAAAGLDLPEVGLLQVRGRRAPVRVFALGRAQDGRNPTAGRGSAVGPDLPQPGSAG